MSRRDAERDVIVLEREGGSSLWWLLVGGAIGAGIALLLAPQAGEKTRRQLGRRLVALRDSAGEALDELKDTFDPGDGEGDEAELEEAEVPASKPSGASGARRELERRLADARARRHRALADEDEEPVA